MALLPLAEREKAWRHDQHADLFGALRALVQVQRTRAAQAMRSTYHELAAKAA